MIAILRAIFFMLFNFTTNIFRYLGTFFSFTNIFKTKELFKFTFLSSQILVFFSVAFSVFYSMLTFIDYFFDIFDKLIISLNNFGSVNCVGVFLNDLGLINFININFPIFISIVLLYIAYVLSRLFYLIYSSIINLIMKI